MTICHKQRALPLESPVSVVSPVVIGQSRLMDPVVRGSDGKFYELKLSRDEAPNVAANEMLGAYLICELGFTGSPFTPVVLDGLTIDALRSRNSQGSRYLIPSDGICCAVEAPFKDGYEVHRWVSPSVIKTVDNRAELFGMFLFDTWARQQEQRECLYLKKEETRTYEVSFVNNAQLFGGSAWRHLAGSARLPACNHLELPEPRDPLIDQWIVYFQHHIPPLLELCMEILPSTWHSGDLTRLVRLSNAHLSGLRDSARRQIEMENMRKATRLHKSKQSIRPTVYAGSMQTLDLVPHDNLEDVLASGGTMLEETR